MKFGEDFFDGGADVRDVVQDLDGVTWMVPCVGRGRCKEKEMAWRGKSATEGAQTGNFCHNHFLFGMGRRG